LGLSTSEHAFKFNNNFHTIFALHHGLACLGTLVSGLAPWAGFLLHSTSAASYWADSTRRGYFLRRLFRFRPASNILAVLPAKKEPDLRIVFLGHADAGFTGLVFNPEIIRRMQGELPAPLKFLKRPMALSTRLHGVLAGFDLLRMFLGPLTLPLRPLEFLLTTPSLIILLANLEILIRNEVSPGANDNLSGVAALAVLAKRFMKKKHPNVEFVFVVTSCEEASMGGADALARDMQDTWDKKKTVVVALDGLAMGDLKFTDAEGEVVQMPVPDWLCDLTRRTAATSKRFAEIKEFRISVGGTDTQPFLARGYDSISLLCADDQLGAPRNYHVPQDTPENLDIDKVLFSIDFTEKLTRAIIKHRLGG